MRVNVVPYDSRWPEQFESVRRELLSALSCVDVMQIEHVGSTAVPGMPAKPILDIDVIVRAEAVVGALGALGAQGYVYEGEQGITDRHAVTAPDDGVARHVYVCIDGCLALRNHLVVRYLLRASEVLRGEYARAKAELASRNLRGIDAYVAGKNAVLQRILAAGGLSAEELGTVAAQNPVP